MVERITWFLERAVEYSFAAFTSWASFSEAIGKILHTFTDLSNGFAWPFLLASMLIAGGVFICSRKRGMRRLNRSAHLYFLAMYIATRPRCSITRCTSSTRFSSFC